MKQPMLVDRSALLAAGLTAVLWGLTGIFVRLLPPLSPFIVTAGRLLLALAITIPILAISHNNLVSLKSVIGRPVAYVFAFLLSGYYLLATAAFQLAPVAEVALLLSTPPLFVLVFRRLRGDIPAIAEFLGALLALGGIALILATRLTADVSLANDRLFGNLLAIGASALTAGYAYLYARLAEANVAPSPIGVTVLTFAAGSVVLMLVIGILPLSVDKEAIDTTALLMFLGLGILCTAVPSFAFAIASRRLPSVVTATISLLIPLFAGVFAFIILDEGISPLAIPGAVCVLGGIALILHPERMSNRVFIK